MEYADNIEELLIQDDIIESLFLDKINLYSSEQNLIIYIQNLEINLQKLENQIKEQKDNKKRIIKTALKILFGGTICLTAFICLLNEFLIYKTETLSILFPLLFTDTIVSAVVSIIYTKYAMLNQNLDNSQLDLEQSELEEKRLELSQVQKKKEVLSKVLEREKEKYGKLQEVISKEKEYQMQNNNQITKVEYLERLEQIRKEINDMLEVPTTEYDNNQTLGLSYKTNIEDDD